MTSTSLKQGYSSFCVGGIHSPDICLLSQVVFHVRVHLTFYIIAYEIKMMHSARGF